MLHCGSIDFNKLENQCISGLSTNDYNEIVEKHAVDHFMEDIREDIDVDTLFNAMEACDSLEESVVIRESTNFSSDVLEEMDKFERNYRSHSSLIQERVHVRKFEEFLHLKSLNCDFKTISADELNLNLRYFYSQLKRKNGECYSGSSLLCIRAALHRHFTTAPLNRQFNIMQDKNFLSANNMLKSKIGESIQSGQTVNHFPSIEDADQQKLALYFDESTPAILQQEIWYNILYYFGNRGREGIRELKVNDFDFAIDSNGKEYVCMAKNITQKNVKPSFKKKDFESAKQARMYANESDTRICPVRKFRIYLSRLPKGCQSLFPKPKKVFCGSQGWYQPKQVIGKMLLGTMMKTISKSAKLSKEYTNHCIRPTVVTNLREDGFDRMEVCSITGHKNEKSIERYDRTMKERTLQKMSNHLCNRKKFDNISISTNQTSDAKFSFVNCQFHNCTF
jgi:site-specific recombinase XerD